MQEVKNARVSLTGEKSKPTKLKEVSSINYARIKTDMDEFNRVLGGGVVPGKSGSYWRRSRDREINPSLTGVNATG